MTEEEKQEQTTEEEEEQATEEASLFKVTLDQGELGPGPDKKSRTVALYEDLSEESASELVGGLMYLHETERL